jgi:ubiquinone biosynthesis protein
VHYSAEVLKATKLEDGTQRPSNEIPDDQAYLAQHRPMTGKTTGKTTGKNNRTGIFDYFTRFVTICRLTMRQLLRVGWRALRGQPTRGPETVRQTFEQIGGCFVKFGQILALQIDFLPREYCDALLSLLDRVPVVDRVLVDGVFEEAFGQLPATLYQSFDYTPIASASIGQVHRAVLHDGVKVAVKVQRPNSEPQFRRDLSLLTDMTRIIVFLGFRSLYFLRDIVRELHTWTRDELDYRREAAHAALLAKNAEGSLTERIPRVYWDLTTSRVLTIEFLEGPSVSSYFRMVASGDLEGIEELKAQGFDVQIFSQNIITNFLSDAFRHGAFHADLHPANLLILPGNMVGYVDFGIVAKLTREARRKQIELTIAYSGGNPDAIYRKFLDICEIGPKTDTEGMRVRFAELAPTWYEEPSINGEVRFRVSITVAMMDMLNIAREFDALVDREMIKYVRSTILVDGLLARMAPTFDIARSLRKVVGEYVLDQSRERIFSRGAILSYLTDLVVWVKIGPTAMLQSLDTLERRHMEAQPPASFSSGKGDKLKNQVAAGFAVWAAAVAFLALTGGLQAYRASPFLTAMTVAFMSSWTCWMVVLVRRLMLRDERGVEERT